MNDYYEIKELEYEAMVEAIEEMHKDLEPLSEDHEEPQGPQRPF